MSVTINHYYVHSIGTDLDDLEWPWTP